ncbi:hypothetical protein GCM10009828_010780 [Actinoplanes couchii]
MRDTLRAAHSARLGFAWLTGAGRSRFSWAAAPGRTVERPAPHGRRVRGPSVGPVSAARPKPTSGNYRFRPTQAVTRPSGTIQAVGVFFLAEQVIDCLSGAPFAGGHQVV